MNSFIPAIFALGLSAAAATAATVTPTSYDMLNGQNGSYTYQDGTYSVGGLLHPNANTSGAALSGGLGELTDGIIATGNWNSPGVEPAPGNGPYVGWASIQPVITFNFADAVDFVSATFHFDGSNAGGVAPPSSVTINGVNQAVSAPASTDPFAFTFDLSGQAPTDTLVATIFDGQGPWVFLSEVTFEANVSAVPLPAGSLLILTGLAGLGAARRRKG